MFSVIAVYIHPRYSNYVPITKKRALSNEKLFREFVCHEVQWICVRPGNWTLRAKFIVCALYLVSLPLSQRWNEKISGSPDTSVRRVLALRTEETACRYGGPLRISWQGFTDTPDILHHLREGSAGRNTPHSIRYDVSKFSQRCWWRRLTSRIWRRVGWQVSTFRIKMSPHSSGY